MNAPQYLDTLGMWDATVRLPEQLLESVAAASQVLKGAPLPEPGSLRAVVLIGVGTGGLAADAVAAYGSARAPLPIWVGHDRQLPAFADPGTLVFAVSASGSSEETIAGAAAARTAGAHVAVVSGDGDLSRSAADLHFPVPTGGAPARTALAASMVPVLMVLARLGILPDVTEALHAAAARLLPRRDALVGPTAEVARRIGRTMPLIYGSSGLAAVAARRWKAQVNENAKVPAFFAAQPDLSHDEVAGWGQNGDVTRQVFSLVTLRHAGEHPSVARQFELVVEATDEVMANVLPVWAEGDDDLTRFFDLVLFGDLVSLHLAGREGTDPGPVPATEDVAAGLALP